jgi:Xaa-Pro aminopeptidase
MENRIPDREFEMRLEKVSKAIREKGIDILIGQSNEADFANVRYLSDYWPIFETCGFAVSKTGKAALLIGPESETFAKDRSRMKKIYKILQYRESAEPDYPDLKLDDFFMVFKEMIDGKIKKIGLAGYQIFPLPVYDAIKKAVPDAEIIKADEIITDLRIIKSEIEIKMMKEAFRISEIALEKIINEIRPEMTELEVVGIAEGEMYKNGAEYEGHPQYVLSGKNSTHAIGRPSHNKIGKHNLIQLDIGARVSGYSSSVGRPICIGKMSPEMKKLVTAGLDLHLKTMEWMKEGIVAKEVVKKFYEYADKLGVKKNILYGPCHGIGLIEVEKPWMEMHSEYILKENMTFQVDTFLYCEEFGLRWENGVVVKKDRVEPLSDKFMKIIEV